MHEEEAGDGVGTVEGAASGVVTPLEASLQVSHENIVSYVAAQDLRIKDLERKVQVLAAALYMAGIRCDW